MFNKFIYKVQRNLDLKRTFDNRRDITREDLNLYMNKGAIIIDVRSPQEFREGHISGAISIPDYQIRKEIEKRIPDKNQLIVLYCETGHRSQRVQQILERIGYTNSYNVYEGIII